MTLLQIHYTNSNSQISRLKAYYEIHNSFDHSLNATYAVTEVERGHGVYRSAG